MSENIRIKTTPGGGDKNVNVKVNQKFDFIEILSLKISQDEAYRRFCSDYGTVVGRVIINNGVGVPNAKVSIFIPIDEVDLEDDELSGLYPFERVTDTDVDGIPYNLVPRNNRGKDECFTPIGTFPGKREVQDNPQIGEIFCKYYKFTTTTNESGDFMFFGVPVGTHYMHVDADISDIGILSQRPYDLIRDGANEKSFVSPTKFKNREESAALNQLKTVTPMSVTVPPFWGDTEECEVGIARADVNLATTIIPSAIFMGSIISDNDKHALSRTCVPRKKLGKMDEVVTGEGRIEMIRKNIDGGVERYDVEGGQVIDEDGAWAYQIPMNLDYYVTAEDGSFVPSGDPTKGIPTRARVRFRAGMNINGDEGRNRTRAKYLIPHNPDKWNPSGTDPGVDFSFDSSTDDRHFRDLSWNEIYTVKNHITRVQARGKAENRNFIGLKNVDDSGDRNPFPFNKMDNDINPLYSILCVIINIISVLVCAINSVLIPLLNIVLSVINAVLKVICKVVHGFGRLICPPLAFLSSKVDSDSCREAACIGSCTSSDCKKCDCDDILQYIPYITLPCDGKEYAPCGFKSPSFPYGKTWDATRNQIDPNQATDPAGNNTSDLTQGTKYVDFEYPNDVSDTPLDAGWIECTTLTLADALDVFKFDFYNDWVNGTLYSFLLKYKIKKRGTGTERFCEVDCRSTTGVDNNNDGKGDNPCKNNKIIDTCTAAAPQGASGGGNGVNSEQIIDIQGGYIKKFEDELYYTPVLRQGDYKLFATDIVSLGSVFECGWQGKPQFYQYLDDTTFNIPPLVDEEDENGILQVSGFDGLIGDISCLGISTDGKNCNNIKRLCELGMGLDELRGNVVPDDQIGNEDVESPFIRGVFTWLNSNAYNNNIPLVEIDNSFPDYQDTAYSIFRNVDSSGPIWVYENSYYFYFGLNKGKTALSKMKQKYFTECTPEVDNDFFVVATNITPDQIGAGQEGAIEISVVGGIGPYTYLWTGPTFDINGTPTQLPVNNTLKDATNLYAGSYTVKVIDSVGNITEGTFIVPGPPSVGCNVQTTPATQNGVSNGEISITITPSLGPYTIQIDNFDPASGGGTVTSPYTTINNASTSELVTGVPAGTYLVTVTDSSVPTTSCARAVTVTEPQSLGITLNPTDVSCFGANDGEVFADITGGLIPYVLSWSNGATTNLINGLSQGTYTLTVTDDNGNGQSISQSVTINENAQITFNVASTNDCTSSNNGSITVSNINGGAGNYTIRIIGGGNVDQSTTTIPAVFTGLPNGNTDDFNEYEVIVTDGDGCSVSKFTNVYVPSAQLSISTSTYDANGGTVDPVWVATISGGIYEADVFEYKISVQKWNGSGWDAPSPSNVGLGNNTSFDYTIPKSGGVPITGLYRFVVNDKNGNSDGCQAIKEFTVS